MPNKKWIGFDSGTPDRLIFGAGAVYRDYGEPGENLIGATRGGATFNVEREDREVEVDGAKGPIKGLRRIISHSATLEVTFLEMTRDLFLDLTLGTATSDGTHDTITPANNIKDSDYFTNIALVGNVSGSSDEVVLLLKNGLPGNEWDIETGDEDEGQLSVTFESHYDPSSLDTPPYEIKWPVAVS